MTMDYLATCILDIGDGRRAEWYDFVWNRTRAIRKVSGLTSPTLTSYCLRVHVYLYMYNTGYHTSASMQCGLCQLGGKMCKVLYY